MNYVKHKNDKPAPPSVIHQVYYPDEDTLDRVNFDIKMAGAGAHMSTTMFIEREFEVQPQLVHEAIEKFTINDTRRKYRPYSTDTAKFTVRPGFVVQENMKSGYFSLNGGSVTLDSKWLGAYRKLYTKDLEPFMKGSGRRFANHNDFVLHQRTLYRDEEDDGYLQPARYIHPDRADRRLTLDESGPAVNDQVYWLNEPLSNGSAFNLTSTLGDIFGWVGDVTTANPMHDAANPVAAQPAQVTISRATTLQANDISTIYSRFSEGDDRRFQEVQTLIRTIYDRDRGIIDHNRFEVNQLAVIMRDYFAVQADNQGHVGTDLADFHDHFTLGVDLRKPLVAKAANFLFHLKTITFILQFMLIAHKYFEGHDHQLLLAIDAQRQRIIEITNGLYIANDLVQKETNLTQATVNLQTAQNNLFLSQRYGGGGAASSHYEKQVEDFEHQIEHLNREIVELKAALIHYKLPVAAAGGQTVPQQVQTALTAANNQLTTLQGQWAAQSKFQDPRKPNHPSFLPQVQIMTRWTNFLFGVINKPARSTALEETRTSKITIYEPILFGACRPSEYKDIGCWAANSCIFPFVERFQFGMEFKKNATYFDMDELHADLDVIYDWFSNTYIYPKLIPVSVKSKLHVTFVEEPVTLPTGIPYIDTVTHRIAQTSLVHDTPMTFNFRDFSLRREPKMILFYTKTQDEYVLTHPTIFTDKSASIIAAKFNTDLSPRVYKIDNRFTVDMVTSRNYPGFAPPIDITGNCLALPYHEIPRRKNVSSGYDSLHGSVTISQDWCRDAPLQVTVYATFFYGDTFFDIGNNYQTCKLELDEV